MHADELRVLRERVLELTDAIDRLPQAGLLPTDLGSVLVPCVLTSTLTAATGTSPNITPGSGTVTELAYDGTHLASTGASGVAVKSLYTTTVASGKRGWYYAWSGANWFVVGDC